MGIIGRIAEATKSVVGKTIQKHIVNYDNDRRNLRFSGKVVSFAARAALQQVSEIETVNITVSQSIYELCLKTVSGFTINTKIIPLKMIVNDKYAEIFVSIPEGIAVGHESWILAFLAKFVDGIFGLSSEKLNSVEGLEIENGQLLKYKRKISSYSFLGLLSEYLHSTSVEIPMRISHGWLELDLSNIVPCGFSVDIMAIVKSLPMKSVMNTADISKK